VDVHAISGDKHGMRGAENDTVCTVLRVACTVSQVALCHEALECRVTA